VGRDQRGAAVHPHLHSPITPAGADDAARPRAASGRRLMAFIEIRDISKAYGGVTVIDHLSLTVEEHQVVSIIGPSGSGKSTLLRCINGLETIDDGEILIHGDRISGPGVDVNAL